MTVALGSVNSTSIARFVQHTDEEVLLFVHDVRCLWCWKPAMADAGVLAGLPRAAAQDIAMYSMQVHVICTQI